MESHTSAPKAIDNVKASGLKDVLSFPTATYPS